MNLEGVTLKLLLEESDKEKALQIYSELRPDYFSTAFRAILQQIKQYYDHYGVVPSLNELKLFRNRDIKVLASLSSIEVLETDSIDLNVALEELANQYAQNEALNLLDGVLDKISIQDRYELLDSISALPLRLEEKLEKSNKVITVRDIKVFKRKEDIKLTQVITGISDEWDHEMGGYYKQDLILIGGRRGSGKSIVCANLVANQHKQNKPSIYFTIEMTAEETLQRIFSILANVEFSKIKQGTLEPEEQKRIAYTKANLFVGGDAIYNKYFLEDFSEEDLYAFEEELSSLEEKDEGRIIIVDDRNLSIGTIDAQISTYKGRYGSDLSLVAVDYLNQVVIENSTDMYDWKDQLSVSKYLKNLARKHDLCIVSPYQIDEGGKARFSKGILDAADTAQIIFKDPEDPDHIVFITDKMRGGSDTGKHKVRLNWKTLTIDPRAVALEEIDQSSLEGNQAEAARDL